MKRDSTYPAKSGAFVAGSLLVATTAYAVYSFGLQYKIVECIANGTDLFLSE